MLGKGEHINRLDFLYSVAAADKVIQVTLEGFGITGDIDHLFGGGLNEGI